jgi:hypothetical protein
LCSKLASTETDGHGFWSCIFGSCLGYRLPEWAPEPQTARNFGRCRTFGILAGHRLENFSHTHRLGPRRRRSRVACEVCRCLGRVPDWIRWEARPDPRCGRGGLFSLDSAYDVRRIRSRADPLDCLRVRLRCAGSIRQVLGVRGLLSTGTQLCRAGRGQPHPTKRLAGEHARPADQLSRVPSPRPAKSSPIPRILKRRMTAPALLR